MWSDCHIFWSHSLWDVCCDREAADEVRQSLAASSHCTTAVCVEGGYSRVNKQIGFVVGEN